MKNNNVTDKELVRIKLLRDLKEVGYRSKPIKIELRDNLIEKLKNKEQVFQGIWGYEETVIPDFERAILSMHNICLLGLRGQAKTKMARLLVELLDEYIPVIEGSELNDDPFNPISRFGKDILAELDDHTPILWVHRQERFTEKLATPDISVADLIGDVDPIKAAALKIPYSDERVIHYGLIPRSHRGIFVINELPDLQARIQVSLFNILQEGDIQIRGFKIRLPLDIQFVFTANPEDYTNRGSIVTPLKDRIGSQIITHYPKSIETGKKITQQEAQIKDQQRSKVKLMELVKDLVEQIAIEARDSEYIDAKSGVSARLTITAFENLWSSAERRTLINGEDETHIRISDFIAAIPSITGKVELVYEGEQEGPGIVAYSLVGKAIRNQFIKYFPNPDDLRKKKENNPYKKIINWFGSGGKLDILNDLGNEELRELLGSVPGLKDLVNKYQGQLDSHSKTLMMEFALHGLAEYSMLSKKQIASGLQFKDLLSSMLSMPNLDEEVDDYNEGV